MNNLFWPIYQNLEKELLTITAYMNFDDTQLKCYSTKYIDLLLRICIEIETISKQLYIDNGGEIYANESEMYFDTVCLDFLESKFKLGKKTIFINNLNTYFTAQENVELTPLYKANKRGSSGSDWKKAYQAVKHNRSLNFRLGNMKNVIRSLGALYILNVFYNNQSFSFENEIEVNKFDASLGSNLFVVKLNKDMSSLTSDIKIDEASIYNLKLKDEIREEFIAAMNDVNIKLWELMLKDEQVIRALTSGQITIENLQTNSVETFIQIIGNDAYGKYVSMAMSGSKIHAIINRRKFIAYLNK